MNRKKKIVFGSIGALLLLSSVASFDNPEQNVSAPQSSIEFADHSLINVSESEDRSPEEITETKVLPKKVAKEIYLPAETTQSSDEEKSVTKNTENDEFKSSDKWYVSSHHSSKYYYHESCEGWRGLSERYLKEFSTEAELKNSVAGRVLHYDCVPK